MIPPAPMLPQQTPAGARRAVLWRTGPRYPTWTFSLPAGGRGPGGYDLAVARRHAACARQCAPKESAMTPAAFVADLDRTNREALDRLGAAATAGEPGPGLTVSTLLKLALKNEIEASEIAALWMHSAPELDVKLALARQAGDEAKHYRLVEERLAALDVPVGSVDPLAEGYTPLFQYLAGLDSTIERVA